MYLPMGNGHREVRWDICSRGVLPKKLIIGFLDTRAFHGNQMMNGFFFQPRGVNFLQVKLNGRPYPVEPFCPDFDLGLVMREYR